MTFILISCIVFVEQSKKANIIYFLSVLTLLGFSLEFLIFYLALFEILIMISLALYLPLEVLLFVRLSSQ